MERAQNYTYPYQATGQSRYASNHGTSSAFSASANPNEDWTKISDLAERRRIQNRIAQRNYRKKLKRRLEDLERRAASSSASPEQSHQELASQSGENSDHHHQQSRRRSSNNYAQMDRRQTPEPLSSDYTSSHDERGDMFSQQCTRQLSTSPPPAFSYPAYSSHDSQFYGMYPQHTAYQTLPVPFTDIPYQTQYLPPATVPTMPPSTGAMKRDGFFAEDDILNPFGFSYASMAGIDIPTSQAYSDASAQTPPLSHSHSFDHSRESSPSYLALPITPASLPGSPPLSVCSVR